MWSDYIHFLFTKRSIISIRQGFETSRMVEYNMGSVFYMYIIGNGIVLCLIFEGLTRKKIQSYGKFFKII